MAIETNELYEALGLEVPKEEAVENPTTVSEPQGGQGGEGQVHEDEGNQEGGEPGEGEEPGEGGEPTGDQEPPKGKPVQSREERARFAAMRRKQEMDAAVAKARQEERQQAQEAAQRTVDAAFAASGMVDPYTGKPITTKAAYDAYRERYAQEQKTQFLQKTGMSEEQFQAFLDSQRPQARRESGAQAFSPAGENLGTDRIQKVNFPEGGREAALGRSGPLESNSGAPGLGEARTGEQNKGREVTQEQVDQELQEIHKLDPSVGTLEEVLALETGEAFRGFVAAGHSFIDAFKLANFDRLQAQRQQEASQRAAQQVRNNTRSKDHMVPEGSRGTGAAAVPAATMAYYRQLMPYATDDEIAAHYNKHHKKD